MEIIFHEFTSATDRIPGGGIGEEKDVVPPLLPKKLSSSLPPMSDFFKVKLEKCYPPLEVYKLCFGLVKRRGWMFDERSTVFGILLAKKVNRTRIFLRVSCYSEGMKQVLSISILEQHKKSTLGEGFVMDDLLNEIPKENVLR